MKLNRRLAISPLLLPLLAMAISTTAGCHSDRHPPHRKDREPSRNRDADGPSGVPRDYVLVGAAGARVFASFPPSAGTGAPPARVGPGFGFAVTERRALEGARYAHLTDGRWLAEAEVTPARPSSFAGAALALGDGLQFGWVVTPQTTVRAEPRPSAPAVATRSFHARLIFKGPCQTDWCPLAVGWARAADLAIPTRGSGLEGPPPPPGDATPPRADEDLSARWLDVDLTSQILVAYQGPRPVYATLISGGIGQPGNPFATPTGVFLIRSKHALVRMDNLEHTGVVPYAYDVPLAQYFADGKALHAALWHDRFGRPSSHGCINLSPRDASWLYRFTAPQVANEAPKTVASPTRPGTTVRIRGALPKIVTIVDLGP